MSTTKKPAPVKGEMSAYQPPQPTLGPCNACGCTVLLGKPPRFPVSGDVHDCAQARVLNAIAQSTRWNAVPTMLRQATHIALGRSIGGENPWLQEEEDLR
jgi:hypothetical protein